jgi:hypothetical protein
VSGIPADDFRTLQGSNSLPAPIGRLHFAIGFFSGFVSRLFTSRELKRQQAMQRWSDQWRRWVARLMSNNTQSSDATAPDIAPLQEALVGQSRAHVVISLGPPPATSAGESQSQASRHYWTADVWYYPLDLHRRQAVAISFHQDQVKSIERFLGPPH